MVISVRSDKSSRRAHNESSSVAKIKNNPFDGSALSSRLLFEQLREDIALQRRSLKPSEQDDFDSSWGIDPSGEFVRQEQTNWCKSRVHDSERSIREEIAAVQTSALSKVKKLSVATDEHIGLEILHLFILDILGRDSAVARIFQSKSAEDFRHAQVVSRRSKMLAWCGVIFINVFFIYYTVLHGFVKGLSWQQCFLAGCIVQLIVEILLNETMECIWVNFLVPDLVTKEVFQAADALKQTINNLCCLGSTDERFFLDAPGYLFVSTNIAKKHPELLESMIVRSYQNHQPSPIMADKWHFGTATHATVNEGNGGVGSVWSRHVVLLASTMAALQVFAASPFVFQRFVLRLLQPWLLTGITFVFTIIADSPLYMALLSVGLAIIIFASFYRYRQQVVQRRRRGMRASDSGESDGDSDDDNCDHDSLDGEINFGTINDLGLTPPSQVKSLLSSPSSPPSSSSVSRSSLTSISSRQSQALISSVSAARKVDESDVRVSLPSPSRVSSSSLSKSLTSLSQSQSGSWFTSAGLNKEHKLDDAASSSSSSLSSDMSTAISSVSIDMNSLSPSSMSSSSSSSVSSSWSSVVDDGH